MATWYQSQIRYTDYQCAPPKEITELHLIEAVSFTDAEARTHFLHGTKKDFQVQNIAKMDFSEVFQRPAEDGQSWWKAKVSYLVFNEKTQKESKTNYSMLINAQDIIEAHTCLVEQLGRIMDYKIIALSQTNIVEVTRYQEKLFEGVRLSEAIY